MIKNLFQSILIIFIITLPLRSQTPEEMINSFQEYSVQYNVPSDLLKAVAFAETRIYHVIPDSSHASCSGVPHSYGLMGLRNDDWFGYSLIDAADLINANPELLIQNFNLNIKGAAALLSNHADELKINRNNFNEWKPVLEKYSGIPQEEVKPFYSFDVFKVLSEGTFINGIEISPHLEIDMTVFSEEVNPKNKLRNIESEDYGPAVWDPSPNYTSNSISQLFSVVHSTEGNFAGALSWLKNPSAQASSHYIIRSSDGYIVQLVRERDRAWHARCWNAYMLGVEHEGFVANPAYFTEAMYQSSAALFKHFAMKFNIPINRFRIVAHGEWQNPNWKSWMAANLPSIDPTCSNTQTHTDPGVYWKWDRYLSLISGQDSMTIHGFEYVTSPWWNPTTSGSTYGISKASTFSQSYESKKGGTYSGKLTLQDSTQTSNWFVRVYYNYPSNDTMKLGTTGYLRIYLRSVSVPSGLKVRLAVDDNAGNITETSTWQTVVADGTWHIYEWKINDPAQWDVWVGGNGQIDGPNTYFDSIQFSCDDPNSGSAQYVIYVDNFEKGTEPLNVISLNLTALLEGFYNNTTNKMVKDTITVLLRNTSSPYAVIDSATVNLDSLGDGSIKFLTAPSGSYYIVIKHRNHLETWSKSGGESLSKGTTSTYNFTDNSSKAFGNNLKLKGSKWCIFSGDVNQDGAVDLVDLTKVDNDVFNSLSGYKVTDLTGDNLVNSNDLILCHNNALNFVSVIKPVTAVIDQITNEQVEKTPEINVPK